MEISLDNIRQAEGINDDLNAIRERIEERINLVLSVNETDSRCTLTGNKIMRICLLAGLYSAEQRRLDRLDEIQLSKSSIRIPSSFFTFDGLKHLYPTMLKLRYKGLGVEWDNVTTSKIIAREMLRGRDYLASGNNLEKFLLTSGRYKNLFGKIPPLKLIIGDYSEDMPAEIDANSKNIPNTQIIIAGATGSGKTNLLAVLINQMRTISLDSPYPVNFLLFDYKGEFSDPANRSWLKHFEVDERSLLNPVRKPLPFTPFKDFTGKPINEINLYSTQMAKALSSVDRVTAGATMSNRLSEAIVDAYKETKGAPITFDLMLKCYQKLMVNADKDDTISSVLKNINRNHLFEETDKINLIDDCFIIDLSQYPKDGPLAKAIVYFVISKLNNIYESLTPQANDGEYVQIRHYTIIDEAHYMLGFDNPPLRQLIAVGRNKGMSIILATQDMSMYKSKYFDFYANAQYPLMMKQQSVNDGILRDIFGVSGQELTELRIAVNDLQRGELIVKDNEAVALEIGRKWKKIKVSKLI